MDKPSWLLYFKITIPRQGKPGNQDSVEPALAQRYVLRLSFWPDINDRPTL